MKLDQVKRGDLIKIVAIPHAGVKEQAIRMGIDEGVLLTCTEVIPAGPVVVCNKRQELAIGRSLARSIEVELADPAVDGVSCCQKCCQDEANCRKLTWGERAKKLVGMG